MRHRNSGPKLNRDSAHRSAMAANMAIALLEHGRIQTTAAKAKLAVSPNLADAVESLLRRRILDSLGLARRAGNLISGFDQVFGAVGSNRAAWLIEAADGADDGRRKLLAKARHSVPKLGILGLFTSEQLGLALGGENVIHVALLAGPSAARWTLDVNRLAGFGPLYPEGWREEP
jgi:ribosomal protein L17